MDRSLIAHIDAILSEVRERNSSENLQIRNPGLKALDHELNSHIQGWSEEPPALPAAFMRKFLTNAKALLWLRPSR
jgi:hypothetical protein